MGAEQTTIIMTTGISEKPPVPVVPEAVKAWTRKWHEETSESPAYRKACEQYTQDLQTLFPDEHLKSTGKITKKGGAARPRADNRQVAVPRVYQFSLQTLALLCPGDLSIKIEARDEIVPMGSMPSTSGHKSRDPWLEQFARTMDDRLGRHFEDCDMVPVLRDFARHCIWFQAGVLKLAYQREIVDAGLIHNRLPDAQDDIQQFTYLMQCFLRGDFTESDEDYQTMRNLATAMGDRTEVEVWQNLVAENIAINRFICDSRVDSLAQTRNARWMGDLFTMTGEEVLAAFAYEEAEGESFKGMTWKGVHPDDLMKATICDPDGNPLIERAREQAERKGAKKPMAAGDKGRSEDLKNNIYLVKEVWAACEGNLVFWLIDGVEYPVRTWRPKKQPRGFYPYFMHCLNPQPGTWYGRSDTQHQGPIQDRINRKKSDQEIARWLSTGGRGIADTSLMDGKVIDDLRNLSPGEILKANMGGDDIRKALIWLEVPYFKEAFDLLDDEADERLTHRMPAAAMGVTDAKTTATAINTANAGSQIAFNDRQYDFNSCLSRIITAAADLVIQEDRPEDVKKESGPHAVWPRVYKEAEAKKIEAAVHARVNEIVTAEVESIVYNAQVTGRPVEMTPEELQAKIDQRVAELTEAEFIKSFGYPEPLTREALFKRLQFKVRVSMNAAMDRERRIMSITNLLQQMIGLGVPINPEPIARLLTSLMGEQDEFSNLFKPDPNQLVMLLAQIAQADPSALTPESAAMVAKMGMMAAQALVQQGVDPTTGQPMEQATAGGAAPAAPAGAPAPAATSTPGAAPAIDPATGAPAQPAPAAGGGNETVVINLPPATPDAKPVAAWKVVKDNTGKIVGISAVRGD